MSGVRASRVARAGAALLSAAAVAAAAVVGVRAASPVAPSSARLESPRPREEARDRREAFPSRGRARTRVDLRPYSWTRYGYVAHGMGKVRHYTVTNTREAFETNYGLGQRVFEADFVFTSDGKLVARHDWSPKRFARFQQRIPKGGVPTLAEFEAMLVRRRYTPLAAEDVVELMRRHPDAWVMTDIKAGSVSARTRGLRQLLAAAGGDESVRRRVIVQIYEEADLAPTRESGIDNVVYTLYHLRTSRARALDFCERNGIRVVTFPTRMATRAFVREVRSRDLVPATHTVNTAEDAARYRRLGVTLLYTDVLHP